MSWARRPITKLQRTCDACRDSCHDICAAWLAELWDEPHHNCPCPCRSDNGELTQQALVEMMREDPERTARLMRCREAFRLGSFDLHHRMARFRRRRES